MNQPDASEHVAASMTRCLVYDFVQRFVLSLAHCAEYTLVQFCVSNQIATKSVFIFISCLVLATSTSCDR